MLYEHIYSFFIVYLFFMWSVMCYTDNRGAVITIFNVFGMNWFRVDLPLCYRVGYREVVIKNHIIC